MKNSISKTLLCGILASSFFIINCQKAPNRGVKAAKAAGGTADVAAADKLANKVVAECTATFLKSVEDAKIPRDKIAANVKAAKDKTKTLTEAEKADIAKIRLELKDKNDLAKAEMDKMKVGDKQADGCKKDNVSYVFDDIKTAMDNLVIDAGVVAEVAADEIQTQTIKDKKDREVKTDAKSLSVGLELIASKELAAVIKSENKAGVVYFKYGSIVKESADYDKDKKSKSTTLCEIRNLTSEDALAEGDKLKILTMAAGKAELERKMYAVTMGKGAQVVSIACFIADGKEKVMAIEFRNAFGANLLTQKQIDDKAKSVVDKDKVARDAAKAEFDKKDKAYDVAKAKSDKASEAYDAKLKEIEAAKDKKDEALTKTLVDAAGTLKAAKEKADTELATATSDREAAKKAYEKFFEGLDNP